MRELIKLEHLQKSPYRCKRQSYGEVCGKPMYFDLNTAQKVDGQVIANIICLECDDDRG